MELALARRVADDMAQLVGAFVGGGEVKIQLQELEVPGGEHRAGAAVVALQIGDVRENLGISQLLPAAEDRVGMVLPDVEKEKALDRLLLAVVDDGHVEGAYVVAVAGKPGEVAVHLVGDDDIGRLQLEAMGQVLGELFAVGLVDQDVLGALLGLVVDEALALRVCPGPAHRAELHRHHIHSSVDKFKTHEKITSRLLWVPADVKCKKRASLEFVLELPVDGGAVQPQFFGRQAHISAAGAQDGVDILPLVLRHRLLEGNEPQESTQHIAEPAGAIPCPGS